MLKCGHSQLVKNAAAMTVSGTVTVVAYVPLKATVSEALEVSKVCELWECFMCIVQALGADVVQTVAVRWRRMCEDLQLQQTQKQMTGTWCQPERVQMTVKGWTFQLCAYHFPEETEQVINYF